jgi:hypothetical protein
MEIREAGEEDGAGCRAMPQAYAMVQRAAIQTRARRL